MGHQSHAYLSWIPGNAANAIDSRLDLPSLEGGKKASDILHKYLQGATLRLTKLSEIKGNIEVTPPGERPESHQKIGT